MFRTSYLSKEFRCLLVGDTSQGRRLGNLPFGLASLATQNVNEVNKERTGIAAASSVCDSTKHNGLITILSLYLLFYHCAQSTLTC